MCKHGQQVKSLSGISSEVAAVPALPPPILAVVLEAVEACSAADWKDPCSAAGQEADWEDLCSAADPEAGPEDLLEEDETAAGADSAVGA